MRPFDSRLVIIAAVLLGGAAISDAQEPAPFAAMEIRLPNGKTLEAQASLEGVGTHPSVLVLSGRGLLATLHLPRAAEAGSKVQLPVLLQAGEQVQQGMLTLDVQENGAFLGGRLAGTFGPLNVSGALRIRWMSTGSTMLRSAPPAS